MLSRQKPVDNFPRDQRHEDPRFGRRIQEPDEPHYSVQQVRIQRADIHGPHVSMAWRRRVTGLNHDRADEGGRQFQAETEVWPLLRCFENPADGGQLDAGKQVMCRVVPVAAVTQQDLLAPLRNHAQGWLQHAVKRLQRHGDAAQVKPFERLDGPIFGDCPRDALNQFLRDRLASAVPRVLPALGSSHPSHSIETSSPFLPRLSFLEDLQDHTIIIDNHSTTLCPECL